MKRVKLAVSTVVVAGLFFSAGCQSGANIGYNSPGGYMGNNNGYNNQTTPTQQRSTYGQLFQMAMNLAMQLLPMFINMGQQGGGYQQGGYQQNYQPPAQQPPSQSSNIGQMVGTGVQVVSQLLQQRQQQAYQGNYPTNQYRQSIRKRQNISQATATNQSNSRVQTAQPLTSQGNPLLNPAVIQQLVQVVAGIHQTGGEGQSTLSRPSQPTGQR